MSAAPARTGFKAALLLGAQGVFSSGISLYAGAFALNSDDLLVAGFLCELLALLLYLASL